MLWDWFKGRHELAAWGVQTKLGFEILSEGSVLTEQGAAIDVGVDTWAFACKDFLNRTQDLPATSRRAGTATRCEPVRPTIALNPALHNLIPES